jgi:TBC1 domain family member 2
MAARPPPTRPHININPSPHFSYSITEWGEDDAWDSASDSETASNSQTTWARSPQPAPSRPSGATSSAPKPVPRKSQNSSSSTLAFSYTHVSAPSPGSYPSHTDPVPPPAKNGWTIVQKESADGVRIDDRTEPHDVAGPDREGTADNDMVFEDLEAEFIDMPIAAAAAAKSRSDATCVRQDAAEIASGTQRIIHKSLGSMHFVS